MPDPFKPFKSTWRVFPCYNMVNERQMRKGDGNGWI